MSDLPSQCSHPIPIASLTYKCGCPKSCYCKRGTCSISVFTDTHSMPPPTKTNEVFVKDLVMEDFVNRAEFGYKKYGTYLQPNNGRDPLIDIYHEMMDGVLYIRQELYKRYGK